MQSTLDESWPFSEIKKFLNRIRTSAELKEMAKEFTVTAELIDELFIQLR